jgi:pyridoxal phosphate enzyme (YggS family)
VTPPAEPEAGANRRAELARNLAAVQARVAAACGAAGRDAGEITLIAVTKTRPAADVAALAVLGLADFGENKDQEAAPKAAAVADMALADTALADTALAGTPLAAVTWHFIGQLQTNKAHSVVRYADVVHSVDRVRLVRALGAAIRGASDSADAAAARELRCLVQVSLDGDPSRGGVPIAEVPTVGAAIEAEPGLVLAGLMAVAPLGAPPETAFAALPAISGTLREINPAATIISAGMSGDLEAAVRNGATHLRIGTALLGNRSLPVL